MNAQTLALRRERDRAYARRYYEANREKILERERRKYAANREKILESRRRYGAANRDILFERRRCYNAANREKVRESNRRYRDRIARLHSGYRHLQKLLLIQRVAKELAAHSSLQTTPNHKIA